MASSWLDLGVDDDLDLDDDTSNAYHNALVMGATVAPTAAHSNTSWASKVKVASQTAGQKNRAPPRLGVPIPPLRHQPKQRQQTIHEEDEASQDTYEFGDKRAYK